MRKHRTQVLEIYRDAASKWRWRYVASNGRILAHSGESYTRRIDCIRAAGLVIDVTDLERTHQRGDVVHFRTRPLLVEVNP